MKISPRVAITLTYMCFGVCVGINIGALPALQERTGVTAYIFGFMAALGTLANISMMALGGTINKRFDHRTVLLFIIPLVFVSMLYTLTANSVLTFAFSFVVFNLMLGTLDLFMNAEGASIEHQAGKSIFASLHGTTLLAMGAFALMGSFISVTYGPVYAAVPALPMLALAYYAVHTAIPHSRRHSDEEHATRAQLPIKALLLIGAVIGLDVHDDADGLRDAGIWQRAVESTKIAVDSPLRPVAALRNIVTLHRLTEPRDLEPHPTDSVAAVILVLTVGVLDFAM